jgi:hypothetical protein
LPAEYGVNIRGVCVHPTDGGTRVHLLVESADELTEAVQAGGFKLVDAREVVTLDLVDRPGIFTRITGCLAEANIALDFAYTSGPWLVLGTRDAAGTRLALRKTFGPDNPDPERGVIRAMDPSLQQRIVSG